MAARKLRSISNVDRYQNATSVFEALDRFLSSSKGSVHQVTANKVVAEVARYLNRRAMDAAIRRAGAMAALALCSVFSLAAAFFEQSAFILVGLALVCLSAGSFTLIARSDKRPEKQPLELDDLQKVLPTDVTDALLGFLKYCERHEIVPIYRDGALVETVWNDSRWLYALAWSELGQQARNKTRSLTAPELLAYRPITGTAVPATKKATQADRNWILDLSPADFKSRFQEFEAIEPESGALQPWSKLLMIEGERFSRDHPIEDGRQFRKALLNHLKEQGVMHPRGRSFEPDELAAVFSSSNSKDAGNCRRFMTDPEYRSELGQKQNRNQQSFPAFFDSENS